MYFDIYWTQRKAIKTILSKIEFSPSESRFKHFKKRSLQKGLISESMFHPPSLRLWFPKMSARHHYMSELPNPTQTATLNVWSICLHLDSLGGLMAGSLDSCFIQFTFHTTKTNKNSSFFPVFSPRTFSSSTNSSCPRHLSQLYPPVKSIGTGQLNVSHKIYWLVVEPTHLKNVSPKWQSSPNGGENSKNKSNHRPDQNLYLRHTSIHGDEHSWQRYWKILRM